MSKWMTYDSGSGDRVGLVEDETIYGLGEGESLLGLLQEGNLAEAAERVKRVPAETVAVADVTIRPLLKPPALRDAMCFHQHIRNCRPTENDVRHSQYPFFWYGNPHSVVGAHDEVPLPPETKKFDYELEVGAVIGKAGENLTPEEAEDAIIGYTIFCDWSARDLQRERLVQVKGKDSATTLGPVLVTKDEIEHRRSGKSYDLDMVVRRNGEEFSRGNWSTINWSFADIVSYVTRGAKIEAGDVIGSGTVGWGCLLEWDISAQDRFPGWLQAGDRVELEIEGIGSLDHTIGAPVDWHPLSSGF